MMKESNVVSHTNLVSINFINITVKTQKSGQMSIPQKVRDFMRWQDGDLPGSATIQMMLSKVSSDED